MHAVGILTTKKKYMRYMRADVQLCGFPSREDGLIATGGLMGALQDPRDFL